MSIVRIASEQLTVEVSSLGSEMMSMTTDDGESWLWGGDAAFWAGRSPVLFPIVGRAPEDRVSVEGEGGPMMQHGFARRSEFELVDSGEDFCRFVLRAGPTSRMSYPFEFTLSLEHRVEGRRVRVMAEVSNDDERPMPFGFGFHPAFVWPLPGCEELEHRVSLDNGGEPAMLRLEDGLIVPEPLPSPFRGGELTLASELFEADAMVFAEGAGAGARYWAGDKAVRMIWENLPNFALWSKPGPFVCLEPWHGMAAVVGGSHEIAERPYAQVLGPGSTARFGFAVTLEG